MLAHHAGRFVRAVRHMREPAARATMRGMLAGVSASSRRQSVASEPDPVQIERITALLATATPERNRGIPIARLGPPTPAVASMVASEARSGRPAAE
jgi:hypothetical protein